MDQKVITLKHSIPIPGADGKDIKTNELILGRLKAKHLKLLPDGFGSDEGSISAQDAIPLIAGMADIPIESAEEIDMEDLITISNEMSSFLSESLVIGKPSSGE